MARVLIESSLPHLDRPFDYSVPASPRRRGPARRPGQGQVQRPGTAGIPAGAHRRIRRRPPSRAAAQSGLARPGPDPRGRRTRRPGRRPLRRNRQRRPARRRAAAHGEAGKGIRSGRPARPGAVWSPDVRRRCGRDHPAGPGTASAWAAYRNGPAFLPHLGAGESPAGRADAPCRATGPAAGRGWSPRPWPRSGSPAAAPSWWCPTTGTSTAWSPPSWNSFPPATSPGSPRTTARRRATAVSCALLSGAAGVAVGTRSAAYAPVRNLGLVVCWDDGDDLHIEQRSPYAHSREVLLLRAGPGGRRVPARGAFAQHRNGAAGRLRLGAAVEAERTVVRRTVPRVLNTADSFELEHDPLARIARLPGAAWRAAKEGLERGPVLVQVARAGYAPSLVCETCREPARCTACSGPLAIAGPAGQLRRAAVPLVLGPGPGVALRHVQRRPAPARRHRSPPHGGGAGPGLSGKTRHHLLRGPGQGHRSGREGAGGGHGRGRAGRPRRLRRGPAARRRLAAAPGKPAGGGGRRPPLVQRRGPGAAGAATAASWSLPPTTPPESAPCCAGIPPATPAGNWPCGRSCSCRPPCGSPPSPAAGPPSGTSPRPSQQRLAAQGTVLRIGRARAAGAAGGRRERGPPSRSGTVSRPREFGEDVRTLLFIPYAQAAGATGVLRAVKAAAAAKRSDDPVQLRLDGVDVL